jgi:hypothetical protein
MITITVNIDPIITGVMEKFRAVLDDKAMLHDAIRAEVEAVVKKHLLALNSRSPNTGYYAKASASVNSTADAQAAIISIQAAGIGLRRFGGEVKPGRNISSKTGQPTKAIALPTKHVPIINQNRARPKDIPMLAFVPNRKGGDTTGYLVEAEMKLRKAGKNKGKYIATAKPKGEGKMMYVLRKRTSHEADPAVLPSDEELQAVAVQAIKDLLETFNDQNT